MASYDTFSNDGENDSYIGYDAPVPSQHYESYSNFAGNEEEQETKVDPNDDVDDLTVHDHDHHHHPPPSGYDDGFPNNDDDDDLTVHDHGGNEHNPESLFSSVPELNGHGMEYDIGVEIDGVFNSSDEPVLPPPTEMEPEEEGVVLREWRRQNAIDLEEKEKREKELRLQILDEANVYKRAFNEKRELNCQTNKVNNREKEKLFLANQENFNKNADKQYWKSISELIPQEVPSIEKKGKKDSEKKPSVVVIQGPKPGKPTDLSRMRHLLLKLKHETPPHLILSPSEPTKDKKDGVPTATGETPNGSPDASKEISPAIEGHEATVPAPITAA